MMRTNKRPLADKTSIYICFRYLGSSTFQVLNKEIYRLSVRELKDKFKECGMQELTPVGKLFSEFL